MVVGILLQKSRLRPPLVLTEKVLTRQVGRFLESLVKCLDGNPKLLISEYSHSILESRTSFPCLFFITIFME